MNDNRTIPNQVGFRQQVHDALKAWNASPNAGDVLTGLCLVQLELTKGAHSLRQATNQVLLQALNNLAVTHERDSTLLRMRFLDDWPVHAVASRLNAGEASIYRWQSQAIDRLTTILINMETRAMDQRVAMLEARLESPSYLRLIGVDDTIATLTDVVLSTEPRWVVAICGIGGIGKTSLADAVVRATIRQRPDVELAWISASQQRFDFSGIIHDLTKPVATLDAMLDALVQQLMPGTPRFVSEDKAIAALRAQSRLRPAIVVVDNLETGTDVGALLPVLRQLANPSKFLLTSRRSLFGEPGVFNFRVPELDEADAMSLIRLEAEHSNLPELAAAGDLELKQIYQTMGGNPLALRLVVGQANFHSLRDFMVDLSAARGAPAEILYEYIYRAAWDRLAELPRRVLLAMPLVAGRGASLEELVEISELAPAQVRSAITELVTLSLVDSRGTLTERRYTIHALTRTFLLEQVARWQ